MIKKDLDLGKQWQRLLDRLQDLVGKRPVDLNAVLFLIGVQELGKGNMVFSKEQKQDLMHLGICKILSLDGYYELEGLDADGWPHWRAARKLPHFKLSEQEKLLKLNIIEYFTKEIGIEL